MHKIMQDSERLKILNKFAREYANGFDLLRNVKIKVINPYAVDYYPRLSHEEWNSVCENSGIEAATYVRFDERGWVVEEESEVRENLASGKVKEIWVILFVFNEERLYDMDYLKIVSIHELLHNLYPECSEAQIDRKTREAIEGSEYYKHLLKGSSYNYFCDPKWLRWTKTLLVAIKYFLRRPR